MNDAVLLIDIGNSRIKWAIFKDKEWLADGVSAHDKVNTLMREWDRFPLPQKVIGCNVAAETLTSPVSEYWQGRGISVSWFKSGKSCCGVTSLYDHPEQLGPDRWAALIGAWHSAKKACLVVSAGTALTMDALNHTGEFVGGLILPGKHLMHESLASGTHALNHLTGQAVDFPKNTADGMASGIALSMSAAVEVTWNRLASRNEPAPLCIVTGGDAEWLAKHLRISVIIAPKLVMEGLLIMTREIE